MHIRSVMSGNVFQTSMKTTLLEICRIMEQHRIGSVVIVKSKMPVGIVTERDIVNAIAEHGPDVMNRPAAAVMKSPLVTADPRSEITEALQVMIDRRIRRLPVCDKKTLIGIVTYGDIMRVLQKEIADVNLKAHELKQEVSRDGLTGMYNQKFLKVTLETQIERVRRYGGMLTLLMIDVDYFKKINDTYGHDAGDTVLMKTANLIRKNTRKVNIVARYGGDEFAVIAPISDVEGGRRLGERLRELVERTRFRYNEHIIRVTLSIGVAGWDRKIVSGRELVQKADKALYLSKKAGRNAVNVVY
ncbi:MAG: GGDEF domain-containing protein [Spirochaetes bacterium]|nr:GGDEF domain-containing protein [Spirochaetota bacterium]